MARTSEAAVRLLAPTSATSDQVNAAIGDANLKVNTLLTGFGYSSALLEYFERLLARSQLTLIDPSLKSARRDDVHEVYTRDDKLDPFLKEAIRLDTSGTLAESYGEGQPRFSAYVGTGYDADLSLPVDIP